MLGIQGRIQESSGDLEVSVIAMWDCALRLQFVVTRKQDFTPYNYKDMDQDPKKKESRS